MRLNSRIEEKIQRLVIYYGYVVISPRDFRHDRLNAESYSELTLLFVFVVQVEEEDTLEITIF